MANWLSDALGHLGVHSPTLQPLKQHGILGASAQSFGKGIGGLGGLLSAALVGQSPKTSSPPTPSPASVNESVGTELSDTAAGDTTALDPFAKLNSLIPDPLASQLFYANTVAPLIQHQVDQMTHYSNLLGNSGGGFNKQLGNEYGALAAALGAQTAQAPAIDKLFNNVSDAHKQQTDIYSLIRSLIASQQTAQNPLAAILQQAGIG